MAYTKIGSSWYWWHTSESASCQDQDSLERKHGSWREKIQFNNIVSIVMHDKAKFEGTGPKYTNINANPKVSHKYSLFALQFDPDLPSLPPSCLLCLLPPLPPPPPTTTTTTTTTTTSTITTTTTTPRTPPPPQHLVFQDFWGD